MIGNLRLALASVLLLAGAIDASPVKARTPYAVKDTHPVPRKWTKIGVPDSDHVMKLTIGLKQHRFDELEQHLLEGKPYCSCAPHQGISC